LLGVQAFDSQLCQFEGAKSPTFYPASTGWVKAGRDQDAAGPCGVFPVVGPVCSRVPAMMHNPTAVVVCPSGAACAIPMHAGLGFRPTRPHAAVATLRDFYSCAQATPPSTVSQFLDHTLPSLPTL
jgi:hypothetical protein